MNRDELKQLAASTNEEMRGDPYPPQTGQRRMRGGIQRSHEQLLDRIGSETAGGQTDGVDHDQPHPHPPGPGIRMGRASPLGPGMPAVATQACLRLLSTDRGSSQAHCMSRRCMR